MYLSIENNNSNEWIFLLVAGTIVGGLASTPSLILLWIATTLLTAQSYRWYNKIILSIIGLSLTWFNFFPFFSDLKMLNYDVFIFVPTYAAVIVGGIWLYKLNNTDNDESATEAFDSVYSENQSQ
ncbi:hypothetical protein [Mucilaginibacter gynuensis]|uniref:hypothetical protein n=1 Tax=Mucilaginibacter gynuensis TaxID=1302236 RepID=UPI0031ED4ADB